MRRSVQQSNKVRNQPVAPPIKMTRSVGLQINLAPHPSVAIQVGKHLSVGRSECRSLFYAYLDRRYEETACSRA